MSTEEKINFLVFAGDRSSNCRELLEKHKGSHPDVTFICKGEQVTICWSTSGLQDLKLDIGGQTESIAASGSKVITLTQTTEIKIVPSNAQCVSTKSFTAKVLTAPTPSRWDGRWRTSLDGSCTKIFFEISDAFMSPNIQAKDIRPDWLPIVQVQDAQGNTSYQTCTTPPFLLGKHIQESNSLELKVPQVTVNFSRLLKAVGTYEFTWQAVCPKQDFYKCNPYAVFPFDITLICP